MTEEWGGAAGSNGRQVYSHGDKEVGIAKKDTRHLGHAAGREGRPGKIKFFLRGGGGLRT